MRKIERLYYKVVDTNQELLNENSRMFLRIEELENENIRLKYEIEELKKTLRTISRIIDGNRRILDSIEEW